MVKNIGTADKYIRVLLGLILLSQVFVGLKTYFGLIGLIPIVTVFINFCPIYKLLGVSTRSDEEHRQDVEQRRSA